MYARGMNIGIKILSVLLIAFLLLVLFLLSRRPIGNYADPQGPFFEGSYAEAQRQFDGRLRVITWNLHYAEKAEQAIEVLKNVPELTDADVLLLQEMDVEGVETIAQGLGYNYVYYPAAIHRYHRKEFGNAILSKWTLSDPAKIVLPNWLPGWLQSRNAARATISVAGREILAYSVHMDTVWMIARWEKTQGEFLVEEVGKGDDMVILGGDFNTWNRSSIALLEKGLGNADLERVSKGSGYTFESSGLRLTLDHLFSGEVLDYQSGVYRQTDVSDHFPVWAELVIDVDK